MLSLTRSKKKKQASYGEYTQGASNKKTIPEVFIVTSKL